MFFCPLLILFSGFSSFLRGSFHNYCRRAKKGTQTGAFFCAGRRAHFPLTSCGRWISSPVHRAPAGRERLLSTRGSPVGSRAPRGEDTSEPVPRLQPGASGAVRSGVRIPYAPGFVKQRIRSPDTLFFYAQAGQYGSRRRRPFGLTDQMVRSLASA